jgi:hypothetical protein
MNHSIHSADRSTHLKQCGCRARRRYCRGWFRIAARTSSDYAQTAHVIKAGKPDDGNQFGCIGRSLGQIEDLEDRAAAGRPFCFLAARDNDPELSPPAASPETFYPSCAARLIFSQAMPTV